MSFSSLQRRKRTREKAGGDGLNGKGDPGSDALSNGEGSRHLHPFPSAAGSTLGGCHGDGGVHISHGLVLEKTTQRLRQFWRRFFTFFFQRREREREKEVGPTCSLLEGAAETATNPRKQRVSRCRPKEARSCLCFWSLVRRMLAMEEVGFTTRSPGSWLERGFVEVVAPKS